MSQTVTTEDGTTHEFPDDATPEEMQAALASLGKPAPPTTMGPVTPASVAAGSAAGKLRRALPDIAGGAAGFAPGWIGPAAAMLAGMGARPFTGEPMSPPMPFPSSVPGAPIMSLIPPEMLAEGMRQAALSGAGLGSGRMLGKLGESIFKGALRPTEQGALKTFPNALKQTMKLRVHLGGEGARSGEAVAQKKFSEAVARTGVLLDQAEMAGKEVPTSGVLAVGEKAIQRAAGSRHMVSEKMKALQSEMDRFIRDNPPQLSPAVIATGKKMISEAMQSGLMVNEKVKILNQQMNKLIRENAPRLTPNEANRLVQSLQEELDAVFAARRGGGYIKGGQRIVTKLRDQMHTEMNKALRQAVPGLQKAKADVQDAMAAKAATAFARKNINKGVPARVPWVPSHVAGFALPAQIRGIEMMSKLGLGMTHPLTQGIARQLPRLITGIDRAQTTESRLAETYRGREPELMALQQSALKRGDRDSAALLQRVLDQLQAPAPAGSP